MKKLSFSLLISLFTFVLLAGCSAKESEHVDNGSAKTEKHRVVATTVAAAEIMDALDIDLVGVPTTKKALPKRYNGLPEVGNPMKPDMEILKSLEPTEVLSVTTLKYDLKDSFKGAGIAANYLNLESLADMEKTIRKLGSVYDRKEAAEKLVKQFEDKKKSVQAKVKGKEKPKVLILLGVPGSYLVATENSYIGDLVRIAGGQNIVWGESMEYLASNTEYLKKSNPDIILRAAHGMPDEVVDMFDKEFKTNDIWKHFDAVKHNRVYDLEESLFGTTGNLKANEALDELVNMIYPS
ncbi:heme ABC transporter substrate-binding protein IsdE [Bacillus sonorensis]|uniref:High-affinity heme uptake system protein IsdE n=2 Tax=Bacillus sonorensis TaxID=119858 RepID=M5P6C0_9BACI|nr:MULTISPECIES: heme ABC transporter substrate-binding protein IsdE [Bacillus]TWK76263.1 High-affinity heme uptake system protein IsdE [Bacillus paralicheniformis]ASB88242.1 High-affinity heme uptake system protein IsdE [Bacillus sonorensis]EME74993.1 iron ABC transporter substrate-binding protein [Bacillus sonorensis L12]MBG9916096.1 heme ABC transporter substrate-binding protein [Bacillus sonorensis]MCF7617661.1 heme ABC transporter substrate-binding protein IsdE [Bacillus sonorensis]